jgi:hypothetical protein
MAVTNEFGNEVRRSNLEEVRVPISGDFWRQ